MIKRLSLALIACSLLPASSLAAQTPENANAPEERGTRSIAVAANASPSIGYWFRTGDRTDMGVELQLDGLYREEDNRLSVGVTPSLKHYLDAEGALAQYLIVGVPLVYSRQELDFGDSTNNGYRVGGLFGFGLEWFPIRHVSLGGHVGMRADYTSQDEADSMVSFGTLSSGIRLHLYF